jgi:hypothetical protein
MNTVSTITVREADRRWMREKQDALGLSLHDDMIVPHEISISEELIEKVVAPFEKWTDELAESLGGNHIAQRTLFRATERMMINAVRECLSTFDWLEDDGAMAANVFGMNSPNTDTLEIKLEHLEYAIKLFKYNLCTLCYEGKTLNVDSPYARLYEKVKGMIIEAGPGGLIHGTLTNRIRSKDRSSIVQDLILSGQAYLYKSKDHGRRNKYVWASFIRKFEDQHGCSYERV